MVSKKTVFSTVLLGALLSVLTLSECLARKVIVYEKRWLTGSYSSPRDVSGAKTVKKHWLVLIVRLVSDDDSFTKEELESLNPDKKAAKKEVVKCMEQKDVAAPLNKKAYKEFIEVLDRCLEPSTPTGYRYESSLKGETTSF